MVRRIGERPRRYGRRTMLSGLLAGALVSAVGCQVEYGGMTLPSGKYMHDDVQYFPPGPDFPWANTQAATQRARMQAMGIDPNVAPVTGPSTAPVGGQTPPPPNPGDPNALAPIGGVPANAPGVPSPPAPGDAPAPQPGADQPQPDDVPAPPAANPPGGY